MIKKIVKTYTRAEKKTLVRDIRKFADDRGGGYTLAQASEKFGITYSQFNNWSKLFKTAGKTPSKAPAKAVKTILRKPKAKTVTRTARAA